MTQSRKRCAWVRVELDVHLGDDVVLLVQDHDDIGSSAINYEANIIMILNEKYNIVAKVNIEFNPYQAQRFRDWVIVSVEKNRGGQDQVDLEFEKHFEFSCFDPNGRTVQEKLIEERLYNDRRRRVIRIRCHVVACVSSLAHHEVRSLRASAPPCIGRG